MLVCNSFCILYDVSCFLNHSIIFNVLPVLNTPFLKILVCRKQVTKQMFWYFQVEFLYSTLDWKFELVSEITSVESQHIFIGKQ